MKAFPVSTRTNIQALAASAASGVVWVVIAAFLLGDRSTWGRLSEFRWWACLPGPLIGIAMYHASRWSYGRGVGMKILWAVCSLYVASGIYGLGLGLLDQLYSQGRSDGLVPHAFLGTPLPIWWGLTFMPFLWPLFGLSYLNHALLARLEKNSRTT